MRVLISVNVFGTRQSLEQMVNAGAIPRGVLSQLGTARKVPDLDSWGYSSPWYTIQSGNLDQDVANFVRAHDQVGAWLNSLPPVSYALLTLCPVEDDADETFACILTNATVSEIAGSGLSLEIAPAPTMPHYPYWSNP